MEVSLNEYIKRSDDIVNNISKLENKNNTFSKNNKKDYNEFNLMLQYLQNTIQHVQKQLEVYKTFDNENTNQYDNLAGIKQISKKKDKKKSITYNKTTNQYELEIDGIKFIGNIGNIYDSKILLNSHIKAHQIVECNKGNECYNILNGQYCKYWHKPSDLLILLNEEKISPLFYDSCIRYTRNFMNTSWIYSSTNYTNKNIRCLGSKHSLVNDKKLVKASKFYQDCLENMKQQVMHDILVIINMSK